MHPIELCDLVFFLLSLPIYYVSPDRILLRMLLDFSYTHLIERFSHSHHLLPFLKKHIKSINENKKILFYVITSAELTYVSLKYLCTLCSYSFKRLLYSTLLPLSLTSNETRPGVRSSQAFINLSKEGCSVDF